MEHELPQILFCMSLFSKTFVISSTCQLLGNGYYPSVDAYGNKFKDPRRERLAGEPICGDYRCVCDGIQADQDFIRVLFRPERFLQRMKNTFVNKHHFG